MLRKILWFLTAAFGLFLTSCEEDITLDIPDYEPRLAVFCVLQPDSLPRLYLNRSRSYFNYADNSKELQYIDDANVVITDALTGIKDTLRADSGFVNEYVNGGEQAIFRHFYIGKHKAQTGHRYILDVTHQGKHVNAETTVPRAITINAITYETDSGSEFFEPGYIFRIKYNDFAGESNAYNVLATYRGYRFTEPGNEPEITDVSVRETFYNYDRDDDGEQMENEYYISMYNDINPDSFVVHFTIENNTTPTAEYIESVYSQMYTGESPFTEPAMIKNNIAGGLGVFGAMAPSKRVRVKVR